VLQLYQRSLEDRPVSTALSAVNQAQIKFGFNLLLQSSEGRVTQVLNPLIQVFCSHFAL
jgi:hypothetical protein